MLVSPDPDYDLVPPTALPVELTTNHKLGAQCVVCGAKFNYNQAYDFLCSRSSCPLGYNN